MPTIRCMSAVAHRRRVQVAGAFGLAALLAWPAAAASDERPIYRIPKHVGPQNHASAAPGRGVIDVAMLALTEVAQVDRALLAQARVVRRFVAGQALPEGG